ncbi:MAG TPA: nitroreductase [Novosphingobium sp.]|nr:nitroreductase [Novosphingobium sp.]HZV08704.1 nitroreductase [Novosphingobium sp.]
MSALSVSEAVATRRSIRAFLDQPVDEAILRRVLEKARMAPSSTNLQPWRGVILAGRPLADLSAALLAADPASQPEYPLSAPETPAHFIARREAIMAERMDALGIAREDKEGRAAYNRKNYEFFGAPACLFTFVPRVLSPAHWASTALWLQTVMLLLVEEGLGSCPQESLAHFPLPIKQVCGIDDGEYFFWCGLAIGWPDPAAPVNRYARPRVPLEESVSFRGFA